MLTSGCVFPTFVHILLYGSTLLWCFLFLSLHPAEKIHIDCVAICKIVYCKKAFFFFLHYDWKYGMTLNIVNDPFSFVLFVLSESAFLCSTAV